MLFSIESANIIKPLIFLVQKSCIFKIQSYLCNAFNKSTSERKFGRGGRVVDCGGLENRCTARYPGFESLSLRSKGCKSSSYEIYTLFYTQKLRSGVFFLIFKIIFIPSAHVHSIRHKRLPQSHFGENN